MLPFQKRREHEASKLRTNFEKKVLRYESYIDKLERRAGNILHKRESVFITFIHF